jgi:hypothetical protein
MMDNGASLADFADLTPEQVNGSLARFCPSRAEARACRRANLSFKVELNNG